MGGVLLGGGDERQHVLQALVALRRHRLRRRQLPQPEAPFSEGAGLIEGEGVKLCTHGLEPWAGESGVS